MSSPILFDISFEKNKTSFLSSIEPSDTFLSILQKHISVDDTSNISIKYNNTIYSPSDTIYPLLHIYDNVIYIEIDINNNSNTLENTPQ